MVVVGVDGLKVDVCCRGFGCDLLLRFVSEFGSRDGDDHGTKCVKGEQL
jgi:hypothetical protein